jgi:hydrogenase-4 component E
MTGLIEAILIFMILSGFVMLGSSRLMSCIRMTAAQGIALGVLALAESSACLTLRVTLIAIAVIVLKGFVFPRLLSLALRESNTNREVEPFVGYVASLMAGVVMLGLSFWVGHRSGFAIQGLSGLYIPVAFFLFLAGLFLIIARKTAINQVVGYLVMENGIYTFGFAVVREIPALVELGVLLDVFVAVFVMGIVIYRINREFDHIDSDRLRTLKG